MLNLPQVWDKLATDIYPMGVKKASKVLFDLVRSESSSFKYVQGSLTFENIGAILGIMYRTYKLNLSAIRDWVSLIVENIFQYDLRVIDARSEAALLRSLKVPSLPEISTEHTLDLHPKFASLIAELDIKMISGMMEVIAPDGGSPGNIQDIAKIIVGALDLGVVTNVWDLDITYTVLARIFITIMNIHGVDTLIHVFNATLAEAKEAAIQFTKKIERGVIDGENRMASLLTSDNVAHILNLMKPLGFKEADLSKLLDAVNFAPYFEVNKDDILESMEGPDDPYKSLNAGASRKKSKE